MSSSSDTLESLLRKWVAQSEPKNDPRRAPSWSISGQGNTVGQLADAYADLNRPGASPLVVGDVVVQRRGFQLCRAPTYDNPGVVVRKLNGGSRDTPRKMVPALMDMHGNHTVDVLVMIHTASGARNVVAMDSRRLELVSDADSTDVKRWREEALRCYSCAPTPSFKPGDVVRIPFDVACSPIKAGGLALVLRWLPQPVILVDQYADMYILTVDSDGDAVERYADSGMWVLERANVVVCE